MRHKFTKAWIIVTLAVAFLITGNVAMAQSSFGQISGTITDSTGAAVPGAAITIASANTQARRSVTSDDNGNYLVTNLPIGTYSISVTKNSFRSAQQTDVSITADAKVTSNFALQSWPGHRKLFRFRVERSNRSTPPLENWLA